MQIESFVSTYLQSFNLFTTPYNYISQNALNKAKQPAQEPRLKRRLSWRKKTVDDRKFHKKNALLSNGTWSRDNEALISKCDIELSDVYIEVSMGESYCLPQVLACCQLSFL